MSNKFLLDIGWKLLFKKMDVNVADVLRRSQLPEGLFTAERPELTTDQYFQLWEGMGSILGKSFGSSWPLHLVQQMQPDTFNPTLFAALCSPNLGAALQRLSKFKRLCGPMDLVCEETDQGLSASLVTTESGKELPDAFVAMELVFLVSLARMATQENIIPLTVNAKGTLENDYTDFFGVIPECGNANSLHFSAADIAIPFLTANSAMLGFFEPELSKRISELNADAQLSEQVKSVLFELLPTGISSVTEVANQLAISKRTLQRKLQQEDTSFQTILQSARHQLAKHYLENSAVNGIELSMLLGFESYNSFLKAFNQWTSTSPEEYRRSSTPANKHHEDT